MEIANSELKKLNPNKIITRDKNDDLDNFFLVLGSVYNDFHSLMLLTDLFQKAYPEPEGDAVIKPTAFRGEWGGMQIYLSKFMIGIVSEFLIFLRKNASVVSSVKFNLLVKKLPRETQVEWNNILSILGDNPSDDFLSKLAQIRNNVVFHYDQSLTEMRKGFIKKFYDMPKDNSNLDAFYSLGDKMSLTRFFYCDGATEEYIKDLLKVDSDKNYFQIMTNLLTKINSTVIPLMKFYLDKKKN